MSEIESFAKHQKVIEENRELLIKADRIRKSSEFRSAMHYFFIQAKRGNITEKPSLDNEYTIKV